MSSTLCTFVLTYLHLSSTRPRPSKYYKHFLRFMYQLPIPQISDGSFSSASKPIFASKYAFFSIFRDLQDLQTFAPLQIQKLQIYYFCENLQKIYKFWVWSGAKVCESCRARKMLKNAYLDAKIGFDTAENEPSEICGIGSWYMYLKESLYQRRARARRGHLAVCTDQPAMI